MSATLRPVGEQLRDWRVRRRLSQLDLALEAEISARHLSFVETGRANPSRDMVMHLAERLDVPLRERNRLLIAAGFAPAYAERGLEDPALASAKRAVEALLKAHMPFPALAIDRHWTLVSANDAVMALIAGVAPALLLPPVNVLRLSFHPDGLAPRVVNLEDWRVHIFARLERQIAASGDGVLAALLDELRAYPEENEKVAMRDAFSNLVTPLVLRTDAGVLSFLSTTTVFGAPMDVTLSELALETFFPANADTTKALNALIS